MWNALAALRHDSQNINFWVDALCIDQANVEERNHQVLRMAAIYRQAQEVVAWIGPEPEQGVNPLEEILTDSGQNEQLLATSNPASEHENTLENSNRPSVLLALIPRALAWLKRFSGLFAQPYWSLIWVVQELAIASAIQVVFGRKSIDWRELCNLVDSASPDIQEEQGRIVYQNLHRQHVAGFLGFQTYRHFQIRVIERRLFCLMDAVQLTSSFLSTDFHDKIYALLGQTQDGTMFVPSPNCTISREEFLPRLTKSFIRNTKALEFIWF